RLAVWRNHWRESPSGHHERVRALPFGPDALHDAIDRVDGRVEEAAAEATVGPLADHAGWRADLDPRELGGPADEGLGAGLYAGREHPADEDAVGGDAIERGCSSEVHRDGVPLVELGGGEGVQDPVGADGERFLHIEPDRERRAGIHDQRLDADMALTSFDEQARQRGHDGSDGGSADRRAVEAGLTHERSDEEPELVHAAGRLGRYAPVFEEVAGLEEADHGFGVADVENQDHGNAFRSPCPTTRTAPLRTLARPPRGSRMHNGPSSAMPHATPVIEPSTWTVGPWSASRSRSSASSSESSRGPRRRTASRTPAIMAPASAGRQMGTPVAAWTEVAASRMSGGQ